MSMKKLKKEMAKELKDDWVLLPEDDGEVQHFVPTGCSALDYIMVNQRNGGIPVGRTTTIASPPAAGKSLLAIHICAEAQKAGALAIYLDCENTFNKDFAERVGLKFDDNFWLPEPPPSVEKLFAFLFAFSHQIDEMKKNNEFPWKYVVIVWDSVAATPCEADIQAENPDPTSSIAFKPRVISKNLTLFSSMAAKKDIAFVCINQLRSRIGGMPGQDPWVEPGGNAFPFYASIRLRISSVGKLKNKDGDIIGSNTQIKVEKTKFGPPFQKCEFPIYWTHGIDDAESIINMLEKKGGVEVATAGAKGKIIWFKNEPKESHIRKVDFKKQFLIDNKFREKVFNEFEKVMTKDMTDPRLLDVEIETETE